MIQVGRVSEVGNIEMQDIIFTNRGPTAGLIHVEWNIQASKPGSAGLWGESCAGSVDTMNGMVKADQDGMLCRDIRLSCSRWRRYWNRSHSKRMSPFDNWRCSRMQCGQSHDAYHVGSLRLLREHVALGCRPHD